MFDYLFKMYQMFPYIIYTHRMGVSEELDYSIQADGLVWPAL